MSTTTDVADAGSDEQAAGEKAEKPKPKKSQATRIVELCADLKLWHVDQEPYAALMVDGHRESWPLRSRALHSLLSLRYYLVAHSAAGRQAIEDALAVLAGRAIHEGGSHPVHTRVAAHGESIYIDLCDDRWRAIEIDAKGWRIQANPPVNFIRRRGMLPLAEPVSGGSLERLKHYLTVKEEEGESADLRAVIGWLVQTYRPRGPYPVLIFGGEQGSGKTTAARVLRNLIDPSMAPVRSAPRDERDLILAARNSWVIALDNLSGAQPWLSDAICRLATGGGMSTRELYTDCDEVIIDVQRPVMLNGIDAIATRPDLVDRAMVVSLDPLPDDKRRSEADLWRDFIADAPALIGAICGAISCAIRQVAGVRLKRLPRMADHAVWIEAASPALGWKPGVYVDGYIEARAEIMGAVLDDSPIGPTLMMVIAGSKDQKWEGTATELLATLNASAGYGQETFHPPKGWPGGPQALGNAMTRLAPSLRARGYEVGRTREKKARDRKWTLRHLGQSSENPSASSAPSANGHPSADKADKADGSLQLRPSRHEPARDGPPRCPRCDGEGCPWCRDAPGHA